MTDTYQSTYNLKSTALSLTQLFCMFPNADTTDRNEQTVYLTEMRILRWMADITRIGRLRNSDVRNKVDVVPIHVKRLDRNYEGRPHIHWMIQFKLLRLIFGQIAIFSLGLLLLIRMRLTDEFLKTDCLQ